MTRSRPRSPWPLTGRITAFFAVASLALPVVVAAQRPQDALDQLLAADRRYAAAAEKLDLIDALTSMFVDSVVMPIPGGKFARTRDEARAAMATNPANRGRITWAPSRATIAADGLHGFTAGYMTAKNDSGSTPLKYIAYWVRGTDGWRVAAYKRAVAAAEPPALPPFALLLPAALEAPSNAATRDKHLRSVIAVEKQFSDSAQKIGLGPAFAIFGRDDAINMGGAGAAGFVVGASEIAKGVGGGAPPDTPSAVSWSADFAFVASSGDLGITFGLIKRNDPGAAGPPFAFFTIWSRPGAKGEWRYIAE